MGVLVNVMSEYKSLRAATNEAYHIRQEGKAVGNRDDNFKKENVNILQMMGREPVKNYKKYFKEHMHLGYNAYQEDLKEDDFVMPRDGKDITKIEGLIVCIPEKISLKELTDGTYNKKDLLFFCSDYIEGFLEQDEKFKNCKILDAVLHMNEVYYPVFEETEDGKLRKLSEEERKEQAYVKPHMHIDYIPLVKAEKKGIEYLKLSRKDLWKSKSKYYNSYREFNDRCHKAVGDQYGYERGTKWEDFGERVTKKVNGEKVKEYKKLHDYQLDETARLYNRYEMQLINEIKEAKQKKKKELEDKLEEELEEIRKDMEAEQIIHIEDEVKRSIYEVDKDGEVLKDKYGNDIFTEYGEELRNGIFADVMKVDLNRLEQFGKEMDILEYLRDNPETMEEVHRRIRMEREGWGIKEDINRGR